MNILDFQSERDCAYIRFVYAALRGILGIPVKPTQMARSWNNQWLYGAGFGDRRGVYHLLSGRVILRQFRVLCVDNFVALRPMEFGIVLPGATGTISDVLIGNQLVNIWQIQAWLQDLKRRERWANNIYRTATPSYEILILNLVTSTYEVLRV